MQKGKIDNVAVKVDENGNVRHYKNGKLHRTNGPAVEWVNGARDWYKNGKLHRTNGPAVEWVNGARDWYKNGKLHREEISEEELKVEMRKRKLATLK